MNTMVESDLPCLPIAILLHHIFPALPIKSLSRFKCLNKQFFSTISDPNFKLSSQNRDRVLFLSNARRFSSKEKIHYFVMNNKAHIEKPKITPTNRRVRRHAVRMHGSCNGLILLSIKDDIFLWNPSILGSYTKVLELERFSNGDYGVMSGLCYDGDTKDYKVVVKITPSSPCCGVGNFFAASLKSKLWGYVSFPYNFDSARVGPVVNDRLHWTVARHNPMGDPDYIEEYDRLLYRLSLRKTTADTIIYFDCSLNMFKMLALPDQPINEGRDEIVGLVVIDECLCMMRRISVGSMDVELVVMKEYGVKESWTSKYIIRDYWYSIIALRMDLVVDTMDYDGLCFLFRGDKDLYAYNHAAERLERIVELGEKYGTVCVSYVESLVTTKEYCWNDQVHKNIGGPSLISGYIL